MKKELELEIFELNKDVLCKISELNKDKVYVFSVEVGDMPRDKVLNLLTHIKEIVEKTGITGIFIPTNNGIGAWNIKELSKYEMSK